MKKAMFVLILMMGFLCVAGTDLPQQVLVDPVDRLIKCGVYSSDKDIRKAWDWQNTTTLMGIEKICPIIHPYAPLERGATIVSTEEIFSVINLKLKLVGIKPVSSEEIKQTKGSPILYIRWRISPRINDKTKRHISVSMDLRQMLKLERNSNIKYYGVTWFGFSNTFDVPFLEEERIVRQLVSEVMEKFIADWLNVNPKK